MNNPQSRRFAFIDRDGTIVKEPPDHQVDRLDKIEWVDDVILSLQKIQAEGYELIMVSNQDGLGTARFPQDEFDLCHDFIIRTLSSQGIHFSEIRICPHLPSEQCSCRKPALGLVKDFLRVMDREHSFVVGDRTSDQELASNMGIKGYLLNDQFSWKQVVDDLFLHPRKGFCERKTKETKISVQVSLDQKGQSQIQTGLAFFDHMLEQIARHSGMSLHILCEGDLHVDDHHTVEDVALALGQALSFALDERRGIERYGCLLPMDESLAEVAIDLGGRPYFVFEGKFPREQVGGLATEMVPHFFRSLADSLRASLHIKVKGENTHHMVESCFKGLARALKGAMAKTGEVSIPSTKGVVT